MKPDILMTHIGQLATLEGNSQKPKTGEEMMEIGIIQDAAVAIERGKISAVGPTREVLDQLTGEPKLPEIELPGMLAIPGFVDSHTHLTFAGSRENDFVMKLAGKTYMEIMRGGGGILSTLKATRRATLAELTSNAFSHAQSMLTSGTTSIEAKSGYGLSTKDEVKMLIALRKLGERLPVTIVRTFLGAHAIPPEYDGNPEGYVDLVVDEMLPAVSRGGLAEFCDVFCEKGVFDIEPSRRILNAAKERGLKLKVHADEIVPLGGAGLAAEVGAVSADHLLRASTDDLEAMRKAGTIATLLPATAFSLNTDYARAREMIDMGLPVALATDFNPNCANESMFFTIALACYKMRMNPREAISASTINAAHAIDRATEVGSIEVGKRADIVVLECPNPEYISYRFAMNLVHTVMVGGEVLHTRLGP